MCTILKVLFRTNKTSPRRASDSKLDPSHAYHCPPFYVTRARQGRCQTARMSSLNGVGEGMHPRELVETIMRKCADRAGRCCGRPVLTCSSTPAAPSTAVSQPFPGRDGGGEGVMQHACTRISMLQTCTRQRQQCLRAIWASTLNVVVKCGPCRHRRPQQHRLPGLAPMP